MLAIAFLAISTFLIISTLMMARPDLEIFASLSPYTIDSTHVGTDGMRLPPPEEKVKP